MMSSKYLYPVKAYLLRDDQVYNPESTTIWELFLEDAETCIREHGGKKTICLQWSNEAMNYQIIILSFEDKQRLAATLADEIIERIVKKISR